VNEAVERALCKQRKLDQLENVMATADEAAAILGISRGLVYDGIKNGTIPAVFVNTRILIPIASLARMIVEADMRAKAKVEQGVGV
jgi:excisionase family DNA binding protein